MSKFAVVKGIEKLAIAKLTSDTASGLIYETPEVYPGIQELGMRFNKSEETIYGDDQLMDIDNSLDSADIEVGLNSFTSAQQSFLLGQTISENGGVYSTQDDQPPFVALLYKAVIKGGYRYGVFYKGRFGIPDETYTGKTDTRTFAYPRLTAKFMPTVSNKLVHWKIDTTDPNCPADIEDTWFASVAVPTADTDPLEITTTAPVDGASSVPANESIIFTFNKVIFSGDVKNSNFFLYKDDTPVDCVLSIDASGKVVTMKPKSNMTSGVHYAHCTANVRSASGVPLEENVIVKFTVSS